MPYHLIAFIASCLVVLWVTPIVQTVGLRIGCVDKPDARKVHAKPMVRLGGVAIFLGNLVALLLVWNAGGFGWLPQPEEYQIWGVTLGGIAFFLIGLVEDLFTLPALVRLIAQFVAASIVWAVGVRVDNISMPFLGTVGLGALSLPLTTIWLVGMTNAMNFIDGLDGLAAGIAAIAAAVMMFVSVFLHQPAAGLLAAALAGGALGFLRYNFNPAKIFMGDGGAYFMGFTLAGIGVIGLMKGVTTVAVGLPFLILAIPIIDTSTVIIERLRRGLSPFQPDKRHLHHRLLKAGLSQRGAVLFIYALTLWVGSLALGFAGIPSGWGYAIGASVLMISAIWVFWQRRRDLEDE